MLNVTLTDDAASKLKDLLGKEDDGMVIRIREAKEGTPCKRKIVLRLSFDEREDEDKEGKAGALPFVIDEELADQYGTSFSIDLCPETGVPTVTPVN